MDRDITSDFVDSSDVCQLLGHRALYINEPDTFQVVKQSAAVTDMLTVYGPDRLFWVNIIEKQDENRFEAQLSFNRNPSSVLCYWLPWRKDGIVRIRLKPSKKYGTRTPFSPSHVQAQKLGADSSIIPSTTAGAAITRAEFDATDGGTACLFFTGMMDGCSTWVAGDSQQPVVYHINRASHPTNVKNNNPFKLESDEHKVKTAQMKKDFQQIQKLEAATEQGKGIGVTPDTHKIHHFAPGSIAAAQAWSKQMKADTGVSGALKVCNQYTSTFGVKSAESWVFYAQDIYQYRTLDQWGNAKLQTLYTASQPKKVYPR